MERTKEEEEKDLPLLGPLSAPGREEYDRPPGGNVNAGPPGEIVVAFGGLSAITLLQFAIAALAACRSSQSSVCFCDAAASAYHSGG